MDEPVAPAVDLRHDRPTAVELLDIIAETLTETVVPATAPHARHQARVAANLVRILQRELATDASPGLDIGDSLIEVDDHEAAHAFAQVQALVRAKLAINKPGYDSHDAAAEAAVIG